MVKPCIRTRAPGNNIYNFGRTLLTHFILDLNFFFTVLTPKLRPIKMEKGDGVSPVNIRM